MAQGPEIPQFRTVRLALGELVEEREVIEIEVPVQSLGDTYRAAERLTEIRFDGEVYYDFGSIGAFGRILFHPSSGRVVEIGESRAGVSLINSTKEKFNECVKAFVERFPFYGADDEGVFEVAASDVEDTIRRIDPLAFFEGGYWYEIRWDIAIGDFATEEFL